MGDTKTVKRLKWRVTIPAFFMLMGLGFVGGGYVFFNLPGPYSDKIVTIPPGASLKTTTSILLAEGIIEPADTFYWIARLSGAADKIRAGEYLMPTAASQADILKILIEGKSILHKITFPEGLSSKQVVDLLNANLLEYTEL